MNNYTVSSREGTEHLKVISIWTIAMMRRILKRGGCDFGRLVGLVAHRAGNHADVSTSQGQYHSSQYRAKPESPEQTGVGCDMVSLVDIISQQVTDLCLGQN